MSDARPNIIFIITDQQRYDTIAALGYDYAQTPHLDRLVREGVSFSNCHVTAPSCAPSRASLFTGCYPHTTGVLKNADTWRHSWIEQLNASGYHCVNAGKMHTWPFTTPCGFHERYVVENKDRYLEGRYFFDEWDKALKARGLVKQQRELYRERPDYGECLGAFTWDLPADLHSDMFVGNTAQWWLRNRPKTEGPLFLQIGFPGPHPPYDPTPDYLARYADVDLPLQEVTREDLASQPECYKKMRVHNTEVDHDSVVHLLEPTAEQRLRQRRHYMANVTMIDHQVGEIMAALEETGYLENAVVVFTSDHGDCLTDHGHSQKWTMYEQVTRVPLIAWSPGRIEGGRTVDELVQLMDIGPAVLELAGEEPDESMEARSVLPVLLGREWKGRDCVFAEHPRDGNFPHAEWMTMVRDRRWKLVHFLGQEQRDPPSLEASDGQAAAPNCPDGQLFDLESDPGEVRNLWEDAGHAEKKRELLEVLLEWRLRSGLETARRSEAWR